MKSYRINSFLWPVWLVWILPPTLFFLLGFSYFWSGVWVLFFTRKRGAEYGFSCKKNVYPIWLCMLFVWLVSALLIYGAGHLLSPWLGRGYETALLQNSFFSLPALLTLLCGILISLTLLFWFLKGKLFFLKKRQLIGLSLLLSPWFYLLPYQAATHWFWLFLPD